MLSNLDQHRVHKSILNMDTENDTEQLKQLARTSHYIRNLMRSFCYILESDEMLFFNKIMPTLIKSGTQERHMKRDKCLMLQTAKGVIPVVLDIYNEPTLAKKIREATTILMASREIAKAKDKIKSKEDVSEELLLFISRADLIFRSTPSNFGFIDIIESALWMPKIKNNKKERMKIVEVCANIMEQIAKTI